MVRISLLKLLHLLTGSWSWHCPLVEYRQIYGGSGYENCGWRVLRARNLFSSGTQNPRPPKQIATWVSWICLRPPMCCILTMLTSSSLRTSRSCRRSNWQCAKFVLSYLLCEFEPIQDFSGWIGSTQLDIGTYCWEDEEVRGKVRKLIDRGWYARLRLRLSNSILFYLIIRSLCSRTTRGRLHGRLPSRASPNEVDKVSSSLFRMWRLVWLVCIQILRVFLDVSFWGPSWL